MTSVVLNWAALRALVNDDEVIAELLQECLRINAPLLRDLRASAQASRWEDVRLIAHNLKGTYANLGALEFVEVCVEFEDAARDRDQAALDRCVERLEKVEQRFRIQVAAFTGSAPPQAGPS